MINDTGIMKSKGVIILATARSGSHMTCDMLFNDSKIPDKVLLGELVELPNTNKKFVYCSIVQAQAKIRLALNHNCLNDFWVVNLRRRNKIEQYISWCVFRAQTQSGILQHSPNWEDYKSFLPWKSTQSDIEMFLMEQYLDFAFKPNQILYYEDLIKNSVNTEFKKNQYPVRPDEIVTDYQLVQNILQKFSYYDR